MIKIYTYIGVGIGSLIIALIVSVFFYNQFSFKPFNSDITKILNASEVLYKGIPEKTVEIITVSEGESRIRSFVAQNLLAEFNLNKKGETRWHVDYFMWTIFLKFYLSKKEIISLWCHFAPYEEGHGLNNSALFHYGRNINQLNKKETISIVLIARAPSLYKTHPEKLEERVNKIIESLPDF